MNRLEDILRSKRVEIDRLRPRAAELKQQACSRTDFRDFRSALQLSDQLAIIAEIKKASPSAGVIAESFDPVSIAKDYEQAEANAISVLTDEQFFQGGLNHLRNVRSAVSLPLLRKDFILDELQILESIATGADAILLIVAALEQKQLADFYATAIGHRIDALVEVHTGVELDRALDAGAEIIGINNRDLTTFEIDLSMTERLCQRIPDNVTLVSESGIKTVQDVARVRACGVDAILVGEALMRGQITMAELRAL
jgi:indole-3-glycerol phosphate synthase